MDKPNRIEPASHEQAANASPASPAAHPNEWTPRHDVQFYATEANLATSVARFLVEGVRVGQPLIVVSTPPHRAAFEREMRSMGVDVKDLVQGRDAIWLDAHDTLSGFMEGSRLNRELFAATVMNALDRLVHDRRYVVLRAYGEMVDLLCRDGKLEAALELEDLWNEAATRFSFSCSAPIRPSTSFAAIPGTSTGSATSTLACSPPTGTSPRKVQRSQTATFESAG